MFLRHRRTKELAGRFISFVTSSRLGSKASTTLQSAVQFSGGQGGPLSQNGLNGVGSEKRHCSGAVVRPKNVFLLAANSDFISESATSNNYVRLAGLSAVAPLYCHSLPASGQGNFVERRIWQMGLASSSIKCAVHVIY